MTRETQELLERKLFIECVWVALRDDLMCVQPLTEADMRRCFFAGVNAFFLFLTEEKRQQEHRDAVRAELATFQTEMRAWNGAVAIIKGGGKLQ